MDLNDKKFGKKEGELILFNDLFVSSNFILRKATLAEASQVAPLMWIEIDIAKRQKWMEQLNGKQLIQIIERYRFIPLLNDGEKTLIIMNDTT